MCSRLYNKIFNILNIYYLVTNLGFSSLVEIKTKAVPQEIALVQFALFLASTFASICLEKSFTKIGRKNTFTIGIILALISSTV